MQLFLKRNISPKKPQSNRVIWGFSSTQMLFFEARSVWHTVREKVFAIYNMSIDRRFVYGPPVGCQSSARDHQWGRGFSYLKSHFLYYWNCCCFHKRKPQFGNRTQWPLGQLSTIFLFCYKSPVIYIDAALSSTLDDRQKMSHLGPAHPSSAYLRKKWRVSCAQQWGRPAPEGILMSNRCSSQKKRLEKKPRLETWKISIFGP